MIDDNKPKEAPQGAKGEGTSGTAGASVQARSAVVLAFFSVVAFAAVLVIFYQSRRSAELAEHYQRSLAHFVGQAELKLANYRQIVSNVTGVAKNAGFVSEATARTRAAQAGLKRMMAVQADAEVRSAATRLSLKEARDLSDRAASEAAQAERHKQGTGELSERASRERRGARALVEDALEATTSADAEATQAETKARAARAAALSANATGEAAPRAGMDGTTASSDATTTVEPWADAGASAALIRSPASDPQGGDLEAADMARDAARAANQRAADARKLAKEADEAADGAERARKGADAKLAAAIDALTRAHRAAEDAVTGKYKATGEAAAHAPGVAEATAASPAARETEAHNVRAVVEKLRERDRRESAAAAAAEGKKLEAGLDAMLAGVLPSYSHTLTEECVGLSDPAQAQVCVAQRLARINQDAKGDGEQKARGLEMVGCSVSPASNGQLAFLSDDRAAILLHPGAGDQTRAACGRVEIDRLLSTGEVTGRADSGRVDADGGGFDEMLLLDRTGTVLYSAARTSGIRIGVLPGFDANKAAASQMARDVVIGGEKYRVFTQPFAFRVGHPGSAAESDRTKAGADLQPPDLVACGLIREDRLLSASINLSPASYLWGVLLVGFGILLLPLTKLWFVGARARFRTFDVAQLATSAVIATLLSVVLVFALIAHNSLSERLDGQLAHVAADLSSRLSRRIDQSIAALDAFTSQTQNVQRAIASNQPRELARDELKAACLPGEIMPGAMFEGDHSSWPVCERTHADLPTLAPGLKWNVAFLTNRLGFQQAKYTRDQHAPPPITVAEREYFRRAIAGRVACFDAGGTRAIGAAPCGRAPGIPQVVRSATSGDIVLLTSRPTYASPEGTGALSEQPTGIAAIETSLAGFQHPLLPLGFQMAVIDMDGIVMLHSDNDARHGQSLLDDLSTSWALRASLKARISDSLNLRYLGTPSRVHVEPLPGTEWFVLTIAPKTLIDSSIAEMVLVTMVGFGMTTLLLLMFAAGRLGWNVARAYRRSGGLLRARDVRHGLAVRPDGRYPQRYAQAGRSMALWSLAICAVVLVVPNVPLTVALLAAIVVACHSVGRLPGLSMERAAPRERGPWSTKIEDVVARIVARVGDFARVRREPQAAQPTETVTAPPVSPPSLRSAYALCCFGLAAVFVITPTVVIFASAYDHVTAALARAEQDHYATALRYDRRCIDTILWGTSACAVVGSGAERTLRPDNDVSDVFRPLALANLVRRRCLTAIRRQRRGEHRPALQGGQPRAPGQAADGLGVGEEARSRGARVGKRTRAAPHDGLADVDPRPLRLGVPRARDHGNAYCLCRWVPRLLSQHRATLFSPRD